MAYEIIVYIINDRSKGHGPLAAGICLAEHFAIEVKVGFRVRELDLRPIDSIDSLFTMPELCRKPGTVEGINRQVKEFLE